MITIGWNDWIEIGLGVLISTYYSDYTKVATISWQCDAWECEAMNQKQTVELCLEKTSGSITGTMELIGGKYIRKPTPCENDVANKPWVCKKLLAFWALQILGPQCSMKEGCWKKLCSSQRPVPSTHFRGAKRVMAKKEHLRGRACSLEYSWSTSALKAQH